ncbi:hypothetical protein NDN08_003590 [Rhodosorus marinus]|uniref:Uncharacterized protein n=1 Tax=Rhodosorus marinus TaxID=101924 RepID=A0AAV8UZT2_9RHOD|nr:hypothetical protein NDN08_003590 [Rhodosorus marinus]
MKTNREKGGDDGGEEEESTDQKAPVAKKLVVGKRVTTFARALASSRKKVRDLALEALQVWLEKHDDLSDVEMQKLWKALFYYIWMADKEKEIEKVIARVVGLSDIAGMPFIRGLFKCMVREWHGIDRLRIDKYYSLINEALDKSLEIILSSGSKEQLAKTLSEFVTILDEEVFSKSGKEGKGLTLHLLEKWTDNILKPLLDRRPKSTTEILAVMIDPLFDLLSSTDVSSPKKASQVLDSVLNSWIEAGAGDAETAIRPPRAVLLFAVRTKLFNMASDKDAPENNREVLYALWTKSKRSCDLLAPEETKTHPTRPLPDPSSKASQKKRKLEAKKKRKQQRQKNSTQQRKGIEKEVAAKFPPNHVPSINTDEANVHAKTESSSDRSSTQQGVRSKSHETEKEDESNGAEKGRRSPDGPPKERKTVRFSLEDNQVHILPKTKRKRKVNRSLFF